MSPSVYLLLVFTLRILRIDWSDQERGDAELRYRLELVEACASATEDRSERYICAKIPRFESNYREDVGRCRVVGKAGDRTAWQIVPRTEEERNRLCLSLRGDAEVAIERIRESRAACRHLPKEEQLALYARGSCESVEGRRLSRHRFPNEQDVRPIERGGWISR